MSVSNRKIMVVAIGMLLSSVGTSANPLAGADGDMQSLIVQGTNRASVEAAVEAVGGQITNELGVINAFGIRLPGSQRAALNIQPAVEKVSVNQNLGITTKDGLRQASWQSVQEHAMHTQQLMGTSVNVAVLDSGQKASVVVVDASDAPDGPSYLDAISAIDWAIANKDQYNIRVLKLPFNAPTPSTDAGDPLYQAVVAAREAQIEVFAIADSNVGI
jgi:hypothetical protein